MSLEMKRARKLRSQDAGWDISMVKFTVIDRRGYADRKTEIRVPALRE